jgi:hypothetical protein
MKEYFQKKKEKEKEDEFPVQLCHKRLDDCGLQKKKAI